ncbi:hypothetical protein ACFX13_030750 [Malus domestica]
MEEIDIPSHFTCPISLEIMRDPVTISTGITSHSQPRSPPHNPSLVHSQLFAWRRADTNSDIQGQRNKNCLKAAGAIEFVASIINKSHSDSSTTEVAIEVLFHLKSSESRLKDLLSNDSNSNKITESLVRVLNCGNYQSRAHAIILLKSFFEVADPVQLISVEVRSFRQIAHVLNDQISQQASMAALKPLVELCPWGRNRFKAVEGGAVSVLTEALLEMQEKRACELILMALEQLCRCAEGRAELLKHGAGLAIVSKKILRVSHVASDRAEMLQVGVVAKLCLVLQVDCRFKSKKAREVLSLHSRVRKNFSCIPVHLLPFYPSSSS